jgi:hypothetical protein
MSAQELQTFDVVITTYQTVVSECQFDNASGGKKKKQRLDNTLFQIKWKVRANYIYFLPSSQQSDRGSFLMRATASEIQKQKWLKPFVHSMPTDDGYCQERPL